jgi:hypothetical protein
MSETLVRALSERLPASWVVQVRPGAGRLALRGPDGSKAMLDLVPRRRLEPRDVVVLRQGGGLAGKLVMARFLGPRTRAMLEEAGASYADETGNVLISVAKPALFVRLEGARRNPAPEAQPLSSLKGPASARVVRALCDFRPPYGVRRLASIAGSSPASVSRVVALLEKDALIRRMGDDIAEVDWAGLLRRWVADYQFMSSNDVVTFLEPRGMGALIEKMRVSKTRNIVTGSLAANRRAPIASVRAAAVYVDDPLTAGARFKLQVAEAGGNVMLVRPLSAVAFERAWVEEGIKYAALSQVAADLFTSPGRGPSEGEELIAWMTKHVDAWRT